MERMCGGRGQSGWITRCTHRSGVEMVTAFHTRHTRRIRIKSWLIVTACLSLWDSWGIKQRRKISVRSSAGSLGKMMTNRDLLKKHCTYSGIRVWTGKIGTFNMTRSDRKPWICESGKGALYWPKCWRSGYNGLGVNKPGPIYQCLY